MQRRARPQGHPLLHPGANLGICVGTREAIGQQRRHHRAAFQHDDLTTKRSQHKGISPQPGRRIDNQRIGPGLQADSLGNRLPPTAAEFAAMGHSPFDKIDKYGAEFRFIQLAQLQTLCRPHQSKRCRQRQLTQLGGKTIRIGLARWTLGADFDQKHATSP